MSESEFRRELRACYLQLAKARDRETERRAYIRLAKAIERYYGRLAVRDKVGGGEAGRVGEAQA